MKADGLENYNFDGREQHLQEGGVDKSKREGTLSRF